MAANFDTGEYNKVWAGGGVKSRPRGHHYNPTTVPYYVYRVAFHSCNIPATVRGMPAFPRSRRVIWVWQRQVRDVLLKLDPTTRHEKHEARKCSRCGRWMLGIQAQMCRERDFCARLNGTKPGRCGDSCLVIPKGERPYEHHPAELTQHDPLSHGENTHRTGRIRYTKGHLKESSAGLLV